MVAFRKCFTAVAVVVLLTSLAGIASAQSVACTLLPSPSATLRAEGLTELVPQMTFRCTPSTGFTPAANVAGQLTLLFNASITNEVSGTALQNITVNGAAASATLAGTNGIQITGVTFVPAGATAANTFTVNGIRVAASQVSSGQFGAFLTVLPTFADTTTTPAVPIFPEGGISTFQVAQVLRGLDVDVDDAAADLLQCTNPVTIRTTGSAPSTPTASITFTENFATAFEVGPADLNLRTVGTRFIARFSSIPAGARIYVSTRPIGTNNATLVSVDDPTGTVGSPVEFQGVPGDAFGGTYKQVTITGGAGAATWDYTETNATNAAAIEAIRFGILVSYTPDAAAGTPAIGTGAVSGNFAPISNVAAPSSTAPIPRFVDTAADPEDIFEIVTCKTTLLFPFVANMAGDPDFDTGIAIANTSDDQAGTCTISYFGTNAPDAQTTTSVPAQSVLAFTFGAGNSAAGISATTEFTGYVVATCNFQGAHGFAFISDQGSDELAMGYLAVRQ